MRSAALPLVVLLLTSFMLCGLLSRSWSAYRYERAEQERLVQKAKDQQGRLTKLLRIYSRLELIESNAKTRAIYEAWQAREYWRWRQAIDRGKRISPALPAPAES